TVSLRAISRAAMRAASSSAMLLAFLRRLAQVGLDGALELERHRPAEAIPGIADRDPHPALADAIFLDIVLLDTLEADADAALQQRRIVIRARRIVAEAVGQRIGHQRLSYSAASARASRAASQRSVSSAAMQPRPAAVTA